MDYLIDCAVIGCSASAHLSACQSTLSRLQSTDNDRAKLSTSYQPERLLEELRMLQVFLSFFSCVF